MGYNIEEKDLIYTKNTNYFETINNYWLQENIARGEYVYVTITSTFQSVTEGEYTFQTYSDDGVKVSVNNIEIISNWAIHGLAPDVGKIHLAANSTYHFYCEYFQWKDGTALFLQVKNPGDSNFGSLPEFAD